MFDFLREKAAQPPPELPKGTVRRRYCVQGVVQGVGFRYRARYAAESLGLTGWVCNEEDGTVTLLPNEAEGIPADAITYALNGSNVIFTLSSETIDNMLDAATDPQEAAAIKQLLAGFNKGIFTYSAADNTAKVTFKYKLTETELTLYIDKGMISETWSAGKAIMNGILALVGEDNPEIAAILTAVIPQVDTMLEGFNKIEVGAKMTRK